VGAAGSGRQLGPNLDRGDSGGSKRDSPRPCQRQPPATELGEHLWAVPFRPLPIEYEELDLAEQSPHPLPGGQSCGRIRSQGQDEGELGLLAPQPLDGVDSERRPGPLHLATADRNRWIGQSANRQIDHFGPLGGGRLGRRPVVGRPGGNHQDREAGQLAQSPDHRQVAEVGRVEGTPKEDDRLASRIRAVTLDRRRSS